MSDIYGIVGVGLVDGQQRLEAASLNAAHASTPGYRRQVAASRASAQAFEAALAAGDEAAAPRRTRGVDLREGQLVGTARALDVAIDGAEGFFGLSDGQRVWLTRAGSFRIDADGLLVGEGGLRVQGSHGDIALEPGEVEIRADGRLVRDGVTLATLKLFRPAAGAALEPGRGSLLAAAGGIEALDTPVRLRSGFVESSNAAANNEVLGLVALTRQVESLVRVTQGYDDVLGRTIQRLGEI
jgi:flagellar basal-body rod protein FlgF